MSTEVALKDYIKIPLFDGTREEWPVWSAVFKTVMVQKGHSRMIMALSDGTVIPQDDDDCENAAGTVDEERFKLKAKNLAAFSKFLTAFDPQTPGGKKCQKMAITHMSARTGYENGNFLTAWEEFQEKFAPKTQKSVVEITKEYNAAALKRAELPSDMVTELNSLRNEL